MAGWRQVGGKAEDRQESGQCKSSSTTNEKPVAPLPPMHATVQHPPETPWQAVVSNLSAAQADCGPKQPEDCALVKGSTKRMDHSAIAAERKRVRAEADHANTIRRPSPTALFLSHAVKARRAVKTDHGKKGPLVPH